MADVDFRDTATSAALREIIETYRMGQLHKAQQEADADLKKWPDDRPLHRARHAACRSGKERSAVAEVKKLMDGKNDRETDMTSRSSTIRPASSTMRASRWTPPSSFRPTTTKKNGLVHARSHV